MSLEPGAEAAGAGFTAGADEPLNAGGEIAVPGLLSGTRVPGTAGTPRLEVPGVVNCAKARPAIPSTVTNLRCITSLPFPVPTTWRARCSLPQCAVRRHAAYPMQ